jgi:hypothetical protein
MKFNINFFAFFKLTISFFDLSKNLYLLILFIVPLFISNILFPILCSFIYASESSKIEFINQTSLIFTQSFSENLDKKTCFFIFFI